jgi:hypothetical protein
MDTFPALAPEQVEGGEGTPEKQEYPEEVKRAI